jgi:hypothetical protein
MLIDVLHQLAEFGEPGCFKIGASECGVMAQFPGFGEPEPH